MQGISSVDAHKHPGTTTVLNPKAWISRQIAYSGYSTGAFAAGGPVSSYEASLVAQYYVAQFNMMPRRALNSFFCSAQGQDLLWAAMNTNAYQLIVPEGGALLAMTYLVRRGHAPAAQEILAEIEPWFNVLRFFPKLKQSNTSPSSDDLTAAMSRVVVSPKLTRADPIAERLYEAHVTCCRLRSVPLRDKSVQAPASELPWVAALVPFLSPPFQSS